MDKDRITHYTTDLYNFSKHFLNVVQTQKTSGKISNKKAIELLNDIDIMLTNQVNEFENFDNLLDQSGMENVKEKFATVSGKIVGKIDSVRKDAASKMLRDDYTALGMLASGYTMLNTLSLARKNDALANFAADNLEKIVIMFNETSKLLPFIVAEEVIEDKEEAKRIAEQSMKEIQLAWKPEHLFVEDE